MRKVLEPAISQGHPGLPAGRLDFGGWSRCTASGVDFLRPTTRSGGGKDSGLAEPCQKLSQGLSNVDICSPITSLDSLMIALIASDTRNLQKRGRFPWS